MSLSTARLNAPKSRESEAINVTISGMTGFARLMESDAAGQWTWEVRSVNGRSLDLRLNLPNGYEALEADLRQLAARYFGRGNMQISLRFSQSDAAQSAVIDETVLTTLMQAFEKHAGGPATGSALAALFAIKGVVNYEAVESDLDALRQARQPALLKGAQRLFEKLQTARRDEGAKLDALLHGQLDEVATLQRAATQFASDQTDAIRQRLRTRLEDMDLAAALDDERFAAEVAALAAKADVTEELDRLSAHVARGKELLSSLDPVGRDLGFLAQELNREANTLCSKSAVLDLTNTGLALKSIIDQFKEQAANVE